MSKIGQNVPPQIHQSQAPSTIQSNQPTQSRTQDLNVSTPQTFEPSQSVLAEQPLPQISKQTPRGTLKAGLMARNSFDVGKLLGKAKQSLDKLDQQINWRTGRMISQLSDFFKPRSADQAPPIQAMYGVIMPGIIDGKPGTGQTRPGNELPPIQAMYGVIMPGIIDGKPGTGQTRPGNELPPIQAMYGVIMPGIIDGPGQTRPGNELPPIQAMYGVIMPPEGWTPVIQPKYGVIRPPMTQADTVKTQQNQ